MSFTRPLKMSDTFHMRVIPFPTPHDPTGMKYTIVEEWKDENGKVFSDSRRQLSSETFGEFALSVAEAITTTLDDFK